MAVRFSVTVRQVPEDGSEVPADGEAAAALAGTAEQFAGLAAWAADEARFLDPGEREEVIGKERRELQLWALEATFAIDSAREERAGQVTSAAGIRHGSVEAGHERGVASVSGPVRVSRLACRNRREPNLYPADARWILPEDPYSLGMRALVAYHLAAGGFGQAQDVIEARTGVKAGRAQLTGLAEDLAAWTGLELAGDPALSTRTGRALIAATGTGLIGAAIFATDPVSGYPPGTPATPVQPSRTGIAHNLAAVPVFLGLPAAALICSAQSARTGHRLFARYCAATAITMLATTALAGAGFNQSPRLVNLAGLFQRASIGTGFGWLTALTAQTRTHAPAAPAHTSSA